LNKIKKGDFYYANGEQYKGELKDISPNGFGTYFYNDKSTFEGNWMDGKRNGSGKFISSNGNVQSGNWSNNEFVIPPPEPKQPDVVIENNSSDSKIENTALAKKNILVDEASTKKEGFTREELLKRIKYVDNRSKCVICRKQDKVCVKKTKEELERKKEIILSTYKDGILLGFSLFFGGLEGKTYDDAINDALKINKYKCTNVCYDCAAFIEKYQPYRRDLIKVED
jgi:hypothetical protein